MAESFFKTLKVECVYDYKFEDQQASATTFLDISNCGTIEKESILPWDIEPQHKWNN